MTLTIYRVVFKVQPYGSALFEKAWFSETKKKENKGSSSELLPYFLLSPDLALGWGV